MKNQQIEDTIKTLRLTLSKYKKIVNHIEHTIKALEETKTEQEVKIVRKETIKEVVKEVQVPVTVTKEVVYISYRDLLYKVYKHMLLGKVYDYEDIVNYLKKHYPTILGKDMYQKLDNCLKELCKKEIIIKDKNNGKYTKINKLEEDAQ